METVEQLIAEWTEMARDLGRQHASGHGSDDQPYDAIDLNAWDDVTGGGMSMGEMAEIQAVLEQAYEEGMRDHDS